MTRIAALIALFLFLMPLQTSKAQKQPTRVAPGVISNNGDYCTTLTPDGKTMYFARQITDERDAIMMTFLEGGVWTAPIEVNFTGEFSDTDPLLTPDGKTMYFMTNRNHNQNGWKDDYDIWAVDWDENKWGDPYRLPDFINSSFTEGFPSVTSEGTLYFFRTNRASRSDQDIWMSEKIGGGFDTPHKVRGNINTEDWDGHPFVNADNTYMIFYSYGHPGNGRCDLFISYFENGKWGDPKNLGDIVNTDACEMVPFVSRDGKTLYFSRIENGNRDIYQVDFQYVLDQMKS